MIKVILFDLGDTLVSGQSVFPHVPAALAALRQFRAADGEPLALALVSDFTMPAPPPTAAKIAAILQSYRTLLDGFGLTEFFTPVENHITLSAHAGVLKPARRVFETALQRLGVAAQFGEVVFMTENQDHLAAVRALGMQGLRFDAAGAVGADFSDWSEAPLLLAQLVAPHDAHNMALALNVRLGVTHGLTDVRVLEPGAAGEWHCQAQRRQSVEHPTTGTVWLPLSVQAMVKTDERGRIEKVTTEPTEEEAQAEAESYFESLADNRQIGPADAPLPPGATHQLETDAEGRQQIKRKRFSAI